MAITDYREITLREARLRRGLTQTQLAHLAGIQQQTVSRTETGKTKPSRRTVAALERVLRSRLVLR